MSTRDEMERDPLQEKLTAWLLGEASAEDAREVEEALADPGPRGRALAAERRRLEQTVALVQNVFPAQERLSEGSMARLLAEAGNAEAGPAPLRALPPLWRRSGALRAAAGVLLTVGLATVLMRTGAGPREDASADSRLASKDGYAEHRYDQADTLVARVELEEEQPADAAAREWAGADADRQLGEQLGQALAGGAPEPPAATVAKERSKLLLDAELGAEASVRKGGVAVLRPEREDAPKPVADSPLDDGAPAGEPRDAEVELLLGRHDVVSAPQEREGRQADNASGDRRGRAQLEELGYGGGAERKREPSQGLQELGYSDGGAERGAESASPPARSAPAGPASPGPDPNASRLEHTGDFFLGRGTETNEDDSEWRFSRRDFDLDGVGPDRELDDAELRRLADDLARRRIDRCRRRPHETPRDMYFRYWGERPVVSAAQDPLSTFSADVDSASYALARRTLREGRLPVREQIRTEEFVNYFSPDLPAPTEETFAVATELAPSLFGGAEERWMLRVAIRGKEIPREERPPLALVFVVDVSGSMKNGGRLELVKHAVRLLATQLDARDTIALVAFSNEARLVLPNTSAARGERIESALHSLSPGGSTNAEAGLKLGYDQALAALDPNVHTRVVLLSDGVANVGETDQDRISRDVARLRERGIYLNTIGVGMGNHNDVFLEQLADRGDGICDYVDSPEAARRAVVERFTGAMLPIASDLKIQVQFDPARVATYRLLGYENRAIADRDFTNDAVDAGEVGSGHQVVALYELELHPRLEGEGPLATVRLRWKAPKRAGDDPAEIDVSTLEAPVRWSQALASFAAAGPGYRRSVLAAQLAECLRRSSHALGDSLAVLLDQARALSQSAGDDESAELAELVFRACDLGLARELERSELERAMDAYQRHLYRRALEGDPEGEGDEERERRIRTLIEEELRRRQR